MNAHSIGARIKAARKAKKLTQEQLAVFLGVKRSVVSKYETDYISPTWDVIENIAAALDVTVSQLLNEEPQEQDKRSMKTSRLDLIAGLIWDLAQKCQSKQEFTEAIQGVISAMFWEV